MDAPPDPDIYSILSHSVRRSIIRMLHEREGTSFTEMMEATGENTGSISFHLKKSESLLRQDEKKKYYLNTYGEKVYGILKQINSVGSEENEKVLELQLYVYDKTPISLLARENLDRICREKITAKCRVEVVDLLTRPEMAKKNGILAIPTLIRKLPRPLIIIGDLSNTDKVIAKLELGQ